ncbi:MAG: type II secretion system F family protein [Candidatus Woesearchaeota archaeon]
MVYRKISKIYPKKIRENYLKDLKYLNSKIDPEMYLGFIIISTLFISIILAFILGTIYSAIPPIFSWIGIFIILQFLVYLPINMRIDAIAKNVESVLPDALQVMSSNLRAGLTIDQALLTSAKPEFGIFGIEMNRIGKEITTGKEITISLMDSTKRINSEKYQKSMALIVSGLRSGGRLAELLSQTSDNLRKQRLVDEKIRSNVMMYVIFIFAAIAIGAPILFGLSTFLVSVLNDVFGQVDIPDSAATSRLSLPMVSFSSMAVDESFILTYSIITLLISSIMGSLIIGLIAKGKVKYGVKYILPLSILSLVVFFIVRLIIGKFMGGLLDV